MTELKDTLKLEGTVPGVLVDVIHDAINLVSLGQFIVSGKSVRFFRFH